MMYRVVLLLSLAAVCLATSVEDHFSQWADEHGKVYTTAAERQYRFSVFQQNLRTIARQNAEHIAIGGDAVFGPNKFTDLTVAEFRVRLGYKPSGAPRPPSVDVEPASAQGLVEWTKYLTPVKNQMQCGSCWAFSATEQIESDWIRAGRKKEVLSPQQIVSCDDTDDGCNGGDTPTAYRYVMKAGGLETAEHYPYTSGTGRTGECKITRSNFHPVANITGFAFVSQSAKEEDKMVAYVSKTGPLSICVAAESWMNYNSGVLRKCTTEVDHCVQATGINMIKAGDAGVSYHIVRNSWGKDWGEEGFIYIEEGKNLCEIASEATFVKV